MLDAHIAFGYSFSAESSFSAFQGVRRVVILGVKESDSEVMEGRGGFSLLPDPQSSPVPWRVRGNTSQCRADGVPPELYEDQEGELAPRWGADLLSLSFLWYLVSTFSQTSKAALEHQQITILNAELITSWKDLASGPTIQQLENLKY